MYPFSIGVMLESFRCDIRTALQKAARMGAQGIQAYATCGEISPENMTAESKKEFLNLCNESGLVISALCGDMGHGFGNAELNPGLIERSKRILDLAKDLNTDIVTTHIGVVPENPNDDIYKIMQEACYTLAEYADSMNAHFAVETGPEPAILLASFLDTLNSTGVAVNMDPANLVMVTGDDPVEAVYTLQKYIVHTHAKDGRMLKNIPSEELYGDIEAAIAAGDSFIELPLGTGKVDFPRYIAALDDISYKGFLTIEREVGDNPEADIKTAVDFLKNLLSKENKKLTGVH